MVTKEATSSLPEDVVIVMLTAVTIRMHRPPTHSIEDLAKEYDVLIRDAIPTYISSKECLFAAEKAAEWVAKTMDKQVYEALLTLMEVRVALTIEDTVRAETVGRVISLVLSKALQDYRP